MNVRDKINQLIGEYKILINSIAAGKATTEQQDKVTLKLNQIEFFTARLMFFDNDNLNDL